LLQVHAGVFCAQLHIRIGGQVKDHIHIIQGLFQSIGKKQVRFNEVEIWIIVVQGEKLSLSRAEVVEDGDLIFRQQGLYEMAADETGTAGNED
jgi:hypothetical protein